MGILNLNDEILYTRTYIDRPVRGTVGKVTKTQVRATLSSDRTKPVGPFKREGWNDSHAAIGSYVQSFIYPFSPEKETELNERADAHKRRQAEAAADRARQIKERNEEIARELAEVRAAMNTPMGMPMFRTQDTMPDGSRIYTIDIPCHPNYTERKKGWERLTIRCWNGKDMDWNIGGVAEMIEITESAYTYCSGETHSFSSVSTSRYATDEEAVWDAIRRQYHSW